MIKLFLSIAIFYLFTPALSQETSEYLGAIVLNDSSLISYKIVFSELEGTITGYSITDLNGDHETKSLLTGSFNDKENRITFKENGIVYTKSPIVQNDFCFVNFEGKLKSLQKNKQISGKFIGVYNNGEECISGMISMANLKKIEEKIIKTDKKIDRSIFLKKETKENINLVKKLDTLNMNLINNGETLSVFTKDQKAVLTIYDAGKEDGDRVDVTIAGTKVLENYTVTRKKKIIPLSLKNTNTPIIVLALNEGTSKPNTVRIEITDSKNFVRTLTNLKEGETAGVTLIKK